MQNNEAMRALLEKLPASGSGSGSITTPAKSTSSFSETEKVTNNAPQGRYTDEWLVDSLHEAGVEILGEKSRGDTIYHFVHCPNESEHTGHTNDSETAVYIFNGWPVFKCQHEHCKRKGLKFADFAQAVGIPYQKGTGEPVPDGDGNNCYSAFFEFNKDGIPTKIIEPKITKWICDNYVFFVLGDLPYFLNESGCYVLDDGGAKMKRIIQSCLVSRLCTSAAVNSIYKMVLFQDKVKKYEELNQYPREWVPFLNGFYDPINDRMIPIRPEHFVINQIPHEYHREAAPGSPVYDKLLAYQLPNEDDREEWLEYAGSCFNRDTSPQKFMIIKGEAGTGKSVELDLLIDCLGADNVSGETLQGLNERFAATALFGKLANICGDISSEDMQRIDTIKKITGEDVNGVKHEKKGKDSFFFTPFAKLLFSANEIPLNRDEKSNAFYRRLMIVVIDKLPEKVDPHLHEKLHGEIDGIIHKFMEALRRFYQRGGYLESDRSKEEVEKLRRSADSVIAFMDDKVEKDVNGKIERVNLYEQYKDYCDDEDRRYPVTRNKFYDRLRDMGIREQHDRYGRYFTGISMIDSDFTYLSKEEEKRVPFSD